MTNPMAIIRVRILDLIDESFIFINLSVSDAQTGYGKP
jgi:hypothetical protein